MQAWMELGLGVVTSPRVSLRTHMGLGTLRQLDPAPQGQDRNHPAAGFCLQNYKSHSAPLFSSPETPDRNSPPPPRLPTSSPPGGPTHYTSALDLPRNSHSSDLPKGFLTPRDGSG